MDFRRYFRLEKVLDKDTFERCYLQHDKKLGLRSVRTSVTLNVLRFLSYIPTAVVAAGTFADKKRTWEYHKKYNPIVNLRLKIMAERCISSRWFRETFTKDCGTYYDFNGVKMPKLSSKSDLFVLDLVVFDTFFLHLLKKPYMRKNVDLADKLTGEGSYLLDAPDCPMMVTRGVL